jgi:hypothetical protein
MATITLKYDARNTIAKKTLDYILSLGVFENATDTGLNAPTTTDTQVSRNDVFLKKVRRSAKHVREIEAGTRKANSLKKLMDEL